MYVNNLCDTLFCHGSQFNTAVEKVQPVADLQEGGAKVTTWKVTSSHVSGQQETETFDAVFVCAGHYSDPHIPDIPGIQHFKGTVLHSHSYKFPEAFAGQSIVVLGAKASGVDISMELAKVGCQVTLSHRGPRLAFPLPSRIRESSTMVSIQDDSSVLFEDGSVGEADVLIFCTGYNFKYPFLDSAELGVDIQQQVMSPLYRYMMPPAFPSLFFIGVCKLICPFPNFNCQVQFALAVLDGTVPLPSQAQMEKEVQQEEQEKLNQGVEHRHLMVIQHDQWDYCQMLARAAGFPPLPPVVRSLYEEVWRQRRIDPDGYRRHNYSLVSASQWKII